MMQTIQEQFVRIEVRMDDMESVIKCQTRVFRNLIFEDECGEGESEYDGITIRQGIRVQNQYDGNLGSIKTNIPWFQGKLDPKAYLEWARKVEQVFNYHNYSEKEKNYNLQQ